MLKFRHRLPCASSGIHHPCRLGCQIGSAACHGIGSCATVPGGLGPSPETNSCQAGIHIEESQGGGSGPIGLVEQKKGCAISTRWCWPCAALPFAFAPAYTRITLSIRVPCYADMFVAHGRARLKARDGKVFELDGSLASIAKNCSQFAYFLYGLASGQHPWFHE